MATSNGDSKPSSSEPTEEATMERSEPETPAAPAQAAASEPETAFYQVGLSFNGRT